MSKINGTIDITYEWEKVSGKDQIKDEHVLALHETAHKIIFEEIAKGLNHGILKDNIIMDDSDGEDGIDYIGKWKLLE